MEQTKIREQVIDDLKQYPELKKKVILLRYEQEHPAKISDSEVIDSMALSRPVSDGIRPAGFISDTVLDFDGSPAINCVCESLHTLRVAAKPQSGKGRRGFGVPYYGVGVAEEADLAFGVVVGDLHQFACAHSWSVSFLCLMHKKSRSHP